MIPREIVEEVLSRTDIHALISGYVTLRRAGSNSVGLCPFHSEKSPSFTVFHGSNSFYCFGCGAGGDAITFVRRMENLEYEDAVERLAKQAGIRLPERQVTSEKGVSYSRERMFAMNRDAARYFHACLHADNPDAHAAYAYLHEKRALSDATITHFGLGYAPNSFDAFVGYMRGKGYRDDELAAGFLCGRAEKSGALYASFRNRVMFPIIDTAGNIIAFGGRVMDNGEPKYKNSSDTPVFKKSKNLFALNFARTACAEQLILCEGYMDVIALHAAGFTNAVATLGTALTEDQVRMMTRYTKKVIISYDMDEAGRKAADRAVRMFDGVGLEVKLLKLSGAKDPDEYIKKFGADKFRAMLDESRSKFDYNFERILAAHDPDVPQEKIKALNEMCELIAGFASSPEREVYMEEAAKRFAIPAASIRDNVNKIIRNRGREAKKQETQKIHQSIAGYADRVNPDFVKNPAAARAEEAVLGLLLLRPEHRAAAIAPAIGLTDADFFTAFGQKVFAFLRDAQEAGRSVDILDEVFTPDEVGRITRMKINRMQLTDNGDAVLAESVATLRAAVAEAKQKNDGMTMESLADLVRRRQDNN